jgi:hypothetical protein
MTDYINKSDFIESPDAAKLQELFNSIFNMTDIFRVPAIIKPTKNSVTLFNLLDEENSIALNVPETDSVKSFETDNKVYKSAVQRTFIGFLAKKEIQKNKTIATQVLSIYLNNALIELTNALGTDVVTDVKNKLIVEFKSSESAYADVEMRVTLLLNRETERSIRYGKK